MGAEGVPALKDMWQAFHCRAGTYEEAVEVGPMYASGDFVVEFQKKEHVEQRYDNTAYENVVDMGAFQGKEDFFIEFNQAHTSNSIHHR
uniref:Uncharacterized protein n=1 Tax=Ditylum brightwellii TaxID=49249 RepID=A0A7S1YVE2_9STRA